MRNIKKNKGFTLIELLVVIAIIGLLSSIILAAMSGAKNKANDATALSDMHQLQNALEMYKNDNGNYPNGTGVTLGALVPTYISVLPKVPSSIGTPWTNYVYTSTLANISCGLVPPTGYVIYMQLDNGGNTYSGNTSLKQTLKHFYFGSTDMGWPCVEM